MDLNDAALFATQLAMGFALAASVGLRAFLPLLAAGVLARQGYLALGPSFEWMASTPALIVFGSAVAFEVLADKVPGLDHLLDAGGTFIKPAAATLLAASLFTHLDPLAATTLGLVGGGAIAGVVHLMKGTTRLASTATTAGLANPLLSVAEDGTAVAGVLLAFLIPVIAAIAALVLLAWGLVRLTRGMRRRSRASPGP
jgi:hypothetical protein